jgi:hypothetical protein
VAQSPHWSRLERSLSLLRPVRSHNRLLQVVQKHIRRVPPFDWVPKALLTQDPPALRSMCSMLRVQTRSAVSPLGRKRSVQGRPVLVQQLLQVKLAVDQQLALSCTLLPLAAAMTPQ